MLLLLAACAKPTPAPLAAAASDPDPQAEAGCRLYERADDDSENTYPWAVGEGPGQQVDLDGDGVPEFIAQVPDSCGTGSCEFEVLSACAAPSTFRPLATFGSWSEVQAGPERSNGWLDLRVDSAPGSAELGDDPVQLIARNSGVRIWNGETYVAPETEQVKGPSGALLAQVVVLPNAPGEEGCPRSRVQVPVEAGWRTLREVPGVATVSLSPEGRVAASVSCSEHNEGVLIEEAWLPITLPELVWSLSWMPPGEADQARLALLGQDPGQLAQLVVLEEGATGWAPGPDLCEDGSVSGERVSWQGGQLDLVLAKDLNEDGVPELIARAPARGGGGLQVLGACNSSQTRFRSMGLLSTSPESTVATGGYVEHHLELLTTDPQGVEQRWVWSGWRYEAME